MQDSNNQRRMSPVVAVLILFQLIFVIFLVITFSNTHEESKITSRDDEPRITIDSLASEVEDFPSNFVDDIEISLTNTIQLNLDNFSISDSSAIIRDGFLKVQSFDDNGFRALSAIVDIPNLQQSYQIFYKYPTEYRDAMGSAYYNNPRAVLCLEGPDIIYPDFECRDDAPSDVRRRIIADYLKYFNFSYFTAFADSSDLSLININPINFDVDTATKNSYIAEVKDAISSLGISPDLFTYKVLQQSDLDYNIPPEEPIMLSQRYQPEAISTSLISRLSGQPAHSAFRRACPM